MYHFLFILYVPWLGDPSVTSVELAQALEAGMNIVKFKMAFSTKGEKIDMLSKMDKAAERCAAKQGVPICHLAICAALKTWNKKIGIFEEGFVNFTQDSEVILTCDPKMIEKCNSSLIYVDYSTMAKDVMIGMEITIGQGNVIMHCIRKIDDKSIKCKVCSAGKVTNLEAVFFRNLKNTSPFLTITDLDILKFCAKYQVDMLMIYYAKDGETIKKIKSLISKAVFKPLILAGICHQEGLDNLDDILKESDGIIFCRDFLQYELDSHYIFRMSFLQKWMAGKCQQVGKPMFITGVFDYVLAVGDISDAEIADVTNALLDGVTGFVITIRQSFDINNTLFAINGINAICCQVEPLTFDKKIFWRMLKEPKLPVNAAEAAVLSCVAVANQTSARIVIITTVTGRTARALLWLRPACIVITLCRRPQTARRLFTCRNVVPLIYNGPPNKRWEIVEEDRVQYAAEFAVGKQWLDYGDVYVALQRSYEGHLFCDVVRVWTVTFTKKVLVECLYSSDEDKGNATVEEPVKKKRRRKKKKIEVVDMVQEAQEEEEKPEVDTTSHVNIIKSEIAPSATANVTKSEKELVEEEEEEAEEDD